MSINTLLLSSFAVFSSLGATIKNAPGSVFLYSAEEDKLTTIYVDLSLNEKYKEGGANPYISWRHQNEMYNAPLTHVANGIYSTNEELPNDVLYKSLQVCAFNGEYKALLSTKYVNDHIPYNYVCMNSDTSILGLGCYDEREKDPGATYETQRIWFHNDNSYISEKDNWGTPTKLVIGYVYEDNWYMTTFTNLQSTYDQKNYYYVDIPYQVYDVHFLRMSESENHNYLIYQNVHIPVLSYGVCYYPTSSQIEHFDEIDTGVVMNADAVMLGSVVEAYLTYGKEDSNGSTKNTVNNLNETWFKNKSASNDDLKNAKILDYTGYAANGNSYEGLIKNAIFSVNEKWNTMKSTAGVGSSGFDFFSWLTSSDTLWIIAIIGVAGLTIGAVTILVIIKKKRKEVNE